MRVVGSAGGPRPGQAAAQTRSARAEAVGLWLG
jgi:hypothetical protein